jgi:uncharacterized membrane protein (DUF4010 family)
MNGAEVLSRLALALAIGFLIGVERGWRQRDEAEGDRAAGLRTFSLFGLAGGLFALLARTLGPEAFAVGALAIGGTVVLFRWRETERDGSFGATTVIAAFVTFALGAYAAVGDMTAAAAAAVATAAILAAKGWLHAWLRTLTWEELRAALILAAMSFVALPILPNKGYGPYEALNPRDIWLMTIAVAGVSFIGYVALKIAGMRYGPLIAGVAGGIVSSTVTTLDLARRARKAGGGSTSLLAGASAAAATMFVRVIVVVALFGPALLLAVAVPLGAAAAVMAGAALLLDQPWRAKDDKKTEAKAAPVSNPFELRTALVFSILLAVITLLSAFLTETFGGAGGVVLAAVAGISDVDAITLSMTRVGGTSVSLAAAEIAILTAVTTNSLAKIVLAFVAGGRPFALRYGAVTLIALAAGGFGALLEEWSF